jgi:hypothetical protein
MKRPNGPIGILRQFDPLRPKDRMAERPKFYKTVGSLELEVFAGSLPLDLGRTGYLKINPQLIPRRENSGKELYAFFQKRICTALMGQQ